MTDIGLREMRQNASELVRRVEAGERITVTVSGRPAAQLIPVGERQWRSWEEIADVFSTLTDESWASDLQLVDGAVQDPWGDG